ncbi:MAG: hypothetical protein JSR44_01685, partial [Spirochaetes bacterium]|nr:hypothetical protein [Spirochaetota bacterium]
VAQLVEKKIEARYAQRVRIHARVSQRIDWNRETNIETQTRREETVKAKRPTNPALDRLIGDLEKYLTP